MRNKGFTLIEMMIVVAILGVMISNGIDLLPRIMTRMSRFAAVHEQTESCMQLKRHLEVDLSQITAPPGSGLAAGFTVGRILILHATDGAVIEYQSAGHGVVRTSTRAGESTRRFDAVSLRWGKRSGKLAVWVLTPEKQPRLPLLVSHLEGL